MANNICVITWDDARHDDLDLMRAWRRIRRQGTHFAWARQCIPQCSPHRASFLTGQLPVGEHGHGVVSQNDTFNGTGLASNALPVWLSDAGYQTGIIGKYFTVAEAAGSAPPGWDTYLALTDKEETPGDWVVNDGTSTSAPDEHLTHWMTRKAIEFVADAAEPWFLWLTLTQPHVVLAESALHESDWSGIFWDYTAETDDAKPSWIAVADDPTAGQLALMRARQRLRLRECSDGDDIIQAVWAYLHGAGKLSSDTDLIMVSDNGDHLWEHRQTDLSKNTPYEECVRTPVVAIGPSFPAESEITVPVYGDVDLTAAVVDISGATAGLTADGTSLVDIAADPDSYTGRATLGHRTAPDGEDMPDGDWIVTATRKLIRWDATGDDEFEAYDLDTDPTETSNWANDPDRLAERNSLESDLDDLLGV